MRKQRERGGTGEPTTSWGRGEKDEREAVRHGNYKTKKTLKPEKGRGQTEEQKPGAAMRVSRRRVL